MKTYSYNFVSIRGIFVAPLNNDVPFTEERMIDQDKHTEVFILM